MILLLGGTSDANSIADRLNTLGISFCLSVTTDYGAEMADRHKASLRRGLLTEERFAELIQTEGITAIVDATHPHAQVISQLAQDISERCRVPYLRYERPETAEATAAMVTYVSSVEAAAFVAAEKGQRIFLTGSKHLRAYVDLLKGKEIFARVMPSPQVLQEAIALGMPMDHLIAMKGPFSQALNKAMFDSLGIEVLITKESGQAGGYEEKIAAALEAGVHTVVIRRPVMDYHTVVYQLEAVEEWLKSL